MASTLIHNEVQNTKGRLLYIDNLKLTIIIFVIMHHLAALISGFGSQYFIGSVNFSALANIWFPLYLSFQQAYFMGLLFMISGYFVAASYDRKGFVHFIGDRFKRLIIPTLIFMVALTLIEFVELGYNWTSFSVISFLSSTGQMWFAVALFAFCTIYGLVRLIIPKSIVASLSSRKIKFEPTSLKLISLILIIAVLAFSIRLVQPIGTSILNFQFCYFASYIVLFIIGIMAYRNNLFAKISYQTGKRWLISAIALGFLTWLLLLSVTNANGTTVALIGGLTWQSGAYSVWESFIAVAMSIGLIGVFREKFNRQNKLVKTLSANSFAVYMSHTLIIVGVAMLLSPFALYPIVQWLMLCVICIPLCFATAHFVFRRIPSLNKIF